MIASVTLPPSAPQNLHGDQVLRKQWAEDVLRSEGVPINPHLPCIESEIEIVLRSPKEVADRLLSLSIVAVKAEGLEHERVQQIIGERGASELFTRNERAFIEDQCPDPQDQLQFSWRYESAWVLLWALRHTNSPQLGPPRMTCDPATLATIVRDTLDLDRHGLRSANDILNEADLTYRYHWAVRQAGIDGLDPPAGLDPGVVMERHHALNWLISYDDATDWDDVGTDT